MLSSALSMIPGSETSWVVVVTRTLLYASHQLLRASARRDSRAHSFASFVALAFGVGWFGVCACACACGD